MTSRRKTMEENKVSVPFVMEHMSRNNRRMFLALLCVCVTFVLTIVVFVFGYTVREKNWLDTLTRLEVTDGVHEQPSGGADR